MLRRFTACAAVLLLVPLVSSKNGYRKPVVRYPKDSEFFATDFFVRGCKNFLESCPGVYKYQPICARSYNGDFKDFPNYCEMQYENCNTWLNSRVSCTDASKSSIGALRSNNYKADKADSERDETFVNLSTVEYLRYWHIFKRERC